MTASNKISRRQVLTIAAGATGASIARHRFHHRDIDDRARGEGVAEGGEVSGYAQR